MEKERWNRIETIIDTALTLHGDERTEFIAKACSEDDRLLAEVYSILRSVEEAERVGFMERAYDDNRELINDLSDRPKEAGHTFQRYIGRQIGPFKITEFLGSGGMGAVFKAARTDDQFRQEVAVKLVREGLHREEAIRRFRLEQDILAYLNHPNIARLYDGGMTDDGIPYLVMEYIDGIPVNQYCDENRLTLDERLTLFKDICRAVQFAHANLVVHRDLKAQNIYVTPDGVAKILDFGVAKMLDTGLTEYTLLKTRPGQKFWTPQYAAPEQVTGEPVTTATDIYALGVLLHKLFTGTYPLDFEGKSLAEIEKTIKEISPSSPSQSFSRLSAAKKSAELRKASVSEIIKQLKGDLDALVLKTIRKEPEYRYTSVSQLVEDIERYQTGLPLIARQGTLKYRSTKFFRRHRTGLIVAAILLISAIGFAGFYTWRIAKERDRAEIQATKAEEVAKFLTGLFEANDPSEALGDTITMREILDLGTQRLETWNQEPLVKAQMLDVIGRVYMRLGRYEKAQPLLKEALLIRRNLLGDEHLDVATTMDNIATLLQERGDYNDAEVQFKNSLEIRINLLGKEHSDIASSLNNLALLLEDKGDYETADSLHRSALSMHRKFAGSVSINVASSLSNLASLLKRKGDYAESEIFYQEALSIRRHLLEDDHPDIALTLNNLGDLLRILERYDEAETLLREALDMRLKVYGEKHPYVASTMNNLALTLKNMGEYDTAEKLYREVLELDKELLGEKHPYVAIGLNNLGMLLMTQKEFHKAEPMFREALSIRRSLWKKGHPDLALSLNNLATLLLQTGRFEEAEKAYREAITMNEKLLGKKHPRTQASLRSLASLLYETGKFESAEKILIESYAVLSVELDAKNKNTQKTLEKLILLYEKWEKPEQAEIYRSELVVDE